MADEGAWFVTKAIVSRTDPGFIEAARGDAPADVVLKNGVVVDVFTRTLVNDVDVALFGGRIAGVGAGYEGRETVDLGGLFVAPGLIDAHMHVESTMMPPSEFVRVSTPHGTTGAVLDPHEIANVLGLDGIRLLMADARGCPMDLRFAASSCVPSSPLEHSGARLEADDLAALFDDERVVALAEMMNFPGVVHGDPGVLAKVALGLRERLVDGHCPGLSGSALQAYVGAGVGSDHECVTAEEALEKVRAGMQVYIREGSAARNVEALVGAVTAENAHRFCFCTDDRHPGDLRDEGHIDHVIRRAVGLGLDPVTAIAMGSLHVATHYRMSDSGAVAPGRFGDLIVFDDPGDLRPRLVYFRGELVGRDGAFVGEVAARGRIGACGGVTLPVGFDASALRVGASGASAEVRVIGMDPTQLVTAHRVETMGVVDGAIDADVGRDLLKIGVVERHGGAGGVGVGFVHGFGLTRGAIASTVAHDAHNLVMVGTNDGDMVAAARALERCGGGQCVVVDGKVVGLLELPIAGLMSNAPAGETIEAQAALLGAVPETGCSLHDPFMPLSFMSLPVIPSLKMSDMGVVDVDAFEVVPLIVG